VKWDVVKYKTQKYTANGKKPVIEVKKSVEGRHQMKFHKTYEKQTLREETHFVRKETHFAKTG
jgi:hypothetical protein